MTLLPQLFKGNIEWAEQVKKQDPTFFEKLAAQQTPEYLWIGCSDSRVPSNQIVGMMPGEIFVHRNIANVVVHTDLNCLSVMQYAVDVLRVKHIMVVGHYGCGGVRAALQNVEYGLIDNWLRNIKDVYFANTDKFAGIESEDERVDLLCELNVMHQVSNVCRTTLVQNAWKRGQELTVHGWIYSIKDGLLRDLDTNCSSQEQLPEIYRTISQRRRSTDQALISGTSAGVDPTPQRGQ
jgi:carbonic anhydrase